jgi:hypothetical protein
MSKCSKIRKATVTKSLRLIVEDIVKTGRKNNQLSEEKMTLDSILVWLAGTGLASVVEMANGPRVWVPSPALVESYEMGDGRVKFAEGKISEIKLGKVLRASRQNFFDTCEMLCRRKAPKRVAPKRVGTISILLGLELGGDVIACTDAEGHLAWKASPEQ